MSLFFDTVISYSIYIFPWLGVGILASFLLDKYLTVSFYQKLAGKPGLIKIILSQVLGMISPLSIMSFLPIARQLTDKGVNPALLLCFFIAERAYDMQSFFIISGLFGLKFAVLNVIAILSSLIITAINVKDHQIKFSRKKEKVEPFWLRQGKLVGIAIVGIAIGAGLKSTISPASFQYIASTDIGGFFTAIVLGFSLYVGPIIGNYPIAKAFYELGMSPLGTFTFLTVSPIFNVVVILLFGGAIGFRKIGKAIIIYTITSVLSSIVLGILL